MKKFLLMFAIIFAGNFFASNVQAEIKNYFGRGAALFDFGDEDAKTTETVKNVAKLRAIKQAFEKAGFFVLSYTEETLNGKTTDEYISAIVRDMATIENEKIDKYFFNSEEYNRSGYIYEANLIAKIDTDKIAKYLQLDVDEKQKLIERDQVAKKNFEEIDSEFENLRKTADQKTQAQIKSELEKIDNKISSQNKPVEQKNIPMIFSQSVEIGYIGYTPGSSYDREFYIDKASAIKATPAKHKTHYTKGLAYWGTGKDLIYCHFDEGFIKFGDENISNTVEVNPISARIYKVNNSKNKTIYIVDTRWGSASSFWRNFGYDVIGKMDNGKWVKYFSVSGSFNPSTGIKDVAPHPRNLICKGDTIIIEFYPNSRDDKKIYEMRYKWDEKAQWFGVERVDFQPVSTNPKIQEAQKYYEIAEAEWKKAFTGGGKPEIAIANYSKAISLNPNLVDAYIGRSVIYFDNGRTMRLSDMSKAKSDLNRALQINPNSARAYRWRAYMNRSLADVNKAIELDKNYLDAYELRAKIYLEQNEYQKAIADYTFILNSPDLRKNFMKYYDVEYTASNDTYYKWEWTLAITVYNGRARAYSNIKNYDAAIADYKRSLELCPNDVVKYHLQQVMEEKNKH